MSETTDAAFARALIAPGPTSARPQRMQLFGPLVGSWRADCRFLDEESGAWSEVTGAEVRVLATFGAIPPDVIGARADVDPKLRADVLAALREACTDDALRPMVRGVFGGESLQEGLAPGYDSLKKALEMATARGLFD